jgi:LmbE family N-acetylglucosaminyl deacetylase
MIRAAALYNASLTQWTFPDVAASVDAIWSAHAGGRDLLLHRLLTTIATGRPDAVLTFDPEHGTTGHEAHRTIAALLIEAGVPNLWMLQTSARFEGDGFVLSNARPDRASVLFANDDWEWLVRNASLHESQFTAAQIESLRTIASEQRRVWWMWR